MQVRIRRTTVPCSHVKARLMSLHNANLLFDALIARGFLLCTARMWKAKSRLQHDILAGFADESASTSQEILSCSLSFYQAEQLSPSSQNIPTLDPDYLHFCRNIRIV
jgi:hypothetical protein